MLNGVVVVFTAELTAQDIDLGHDFVHAELIHHHQMLDLTDQRVQLGWVGVAKTQFPVLFSHAPTLEGLCPTVPHLEQIQRLSLGQPQS